MQQDKSAVADKEKGCDTISNSTGIDPPSYLDWVRVNLQISLPSYNVSIIQKQNEHTQEEEVQTGLFSIVLTSQKRFKQKFQMFNEAFLDQNSFSLYVKHLVLFNHIQLTISNKQSMLMAVNFCNKINKFFESFRLITDPISGKIYFETKSFLNQFSLSHLKKHILRQDCFYTEIILSSIKKAQRYIDLILYLIGQISLKELLSNQHISKQFQFLSECLQILQKLNQNIFYMPFVDLDVQKKYDTQPFKQQQSEFYAKFFKTWKSYSEQRELDKKKGQQTLKIRQRQMKLSKIKQDILKHSLQYFSQNTEKALKQFLPQNLYQNVNFSLNPYHFSPQYKDFDKTIVEIEKQSVQNRRILSFIEIIQQGLSGEEDQSNWKLISQGGFGIIQLGTIKYKNLSTSYKQPQTGFSLMIKQQMIRKRDRNLKKGKIQRQRKTLQRLQFFSHPNIMSFYISYQYEYQNCIFSDYTPNMSLDVYMKKNEYSMTFNQKLSFMIQAVEGLRFLHQNSIVHLDIKPGNMLINKQLRLLLSDFGEAFIIGQDDPITHNHAYTVPYCAPEIFNEKAQLTQKADIYAIGVCILRILLGEHFMETFLRKKFVKRLGKNDFLNFGLGEKYQKSLMYPIFKIITFMAWKLVSEISKLRPQLGWIGQILAQCRNFIFTLIY